MSQTTTTDCILRTRALNTHKLFAALMPFIPRAERLALNAEVAACRLGTEGLPYSAVVRELSVMANELSDEIDGVTSAFRGFARTIAAWSKADLKGALFLRALVRMRESSRPMSAEVTALIDISDAIGRTSRLVDAVQSDHDDRGVDLVLQCLLREEIDSLNALSDLERGAKRIADSVERIQQAATRRSRFIAITAMVESAKITVGGAVLSQVSEDIRQLSEELADAGTEARRAIAVVLNQTAERLNPLMESIERVRMMEVAR